MSSTGSSITSFVLFGFKKLIVPKRRSTTISTSRVKTSILYAETLWMVTDVLLCVLIFLHERIQLYISLRIKMSTNTWHNSVHFWMTETSAVCPKYWKAQRLLNVSMTLTLFFNLEPGNVCYNMLVKNV